ncbi:MAG TPA: class I SAM-dependent methyltransferase [Solirubrobacterales bacterium]|nr:class I SAM-dependent methyltransferase [Solirubrobacterales bacterium]
MQRGGRFRGYLQERLDGVAPSRRLRLAAAEALIVELRGEGPLRVIDAACGDGLLSTALAKRHPEWQVVGLDNSEVLLAKARARAKAASLDNVSFQQADLTRPLPLGDQDVVIAIECLAEIPQDREAVRQMAEALRPGGLFVVHVPDRDWRPILPGSAATWRDEVRHGYAPEELRQLLREAGIEQVAVSPTYRSLAAIAQETRDRFRRSPLPLRAALSPFLLAAVWLERRGITWGRPSAMLASGSAPAAGE